MGFSWMRSTARLGQVGSTVGLLPVRGMLPRFRRDDMSVVKIRLDLRSRGCRLARSRKEARVQKEMNRAAAPIYLDAPALARENVK